MTNAIVPMAGDVNLRSQWDTVISAIESASGNESLFTIAGGIGVLVVVIAFIVWAISKRRGNGSGFFTGQDGNKIGGAVITGLVLTCPKIIIPAFLWLIDLLGNAVFQFLRNSGVNI